MIPIYKEDPGLPGSEDCVFCKQPTKFWHKGTNNPVCPACTSKHKVSELTNWLKPKRSNTNQPHQ